MIFGRKDYGAAMKRPMIVVLALALAGCDGPEEKAQVARQMARACASRLALAATRAESVMVMGDPTSRYSCAFLVQADTAPRADGGR